MHLKHFKNAKLGFACAALLLLAAACAFAQDSDDWFYGKPISNIKFEGLVSVRKSDLTGITKNFVGKPFSDELYSELLSRIGATEYFASYELNLEPGTAAYDSVVLTFIVEENPLIRKIEFVGNRKITQTELKSLIKIKEKDIFNEAALSAEENKIRENYLKKGYTNIRVGATYTETDDGVDVSFLINEGTATAIRSIKFEGNQVFSVKTLKGLMKLKQKSIFTRGAFQESTLEVDKQAIMTYYLNRGYIDMAIVDVIREETLDNDGNNVLDLTFVISEGYQYTYGGTEFDGNWLFSSDYLGSKIKLEPNDIFNYTKFEEGLSNLSDAYYENGYITTAIIPEQNKNVYMRQISFVIHIIEGTRSHVESVTVQGNKKTQDDVILREMPLKSGDIFSRTKLMNGMRNLYNSQYFSAIVPDILQGSEEDLVNVVLNVEEQSTTSIEFGLSFAGLSDPNAFPVSLFGSWRDSNVGGTGRSVSTTLNLSPDTQALSLSYGDNWLWDRPISFSSSLSASRSKETTAQKVWTPTGLDTTNYGMSYNAFNITLSNSLGRRWYPGDAVVSLKGGLANSFMRNIYDSALVPVDTTISDYEHSWGYRNTVWAGLSADKRDLAANPSSGWFLSEQLSYTGLIPTLENQFYVKSDTIGEYYFTLCDVPVTEKWNLKAVFAAISTFSLVHPVRGTLANSNRLYIDGMFAGRGWDKISSVKGNVMWSNNFEVRVPVFENIISLDAFFDAVALKDSLSSGSNFSMNNFYFSFGPGVSSLVAQLPLRVMIANTFRMEDGKFKWGKGNGPEWNVVLSFKVTNN